jgi:hypothetical protein
MSTVEMRSEVAGWLENLDEDFLAAVHAMVSTYVTRQEGSPVFGYDADGTPLYAEEMKKAYAAEVEGVKRGEYLTIEDFEEESTTW